MMLNQISSLCGQLQSTMALAKAPPASRDARTRSCGSVRVLTADVVHFLTWVSSVNQMCYNPHSRPTR